MSQTVEQARMLVSRGDVRGAAGLLKQAEQAGDAAAARELATWCLTGELIRRDLAGARAFFERAAALGDVESAATVRAFLAAGVGGPADWARAVQLLKQASDRDPAAAAELKLIAQMKLDADGEPLGQIEVERLSSRPDVSMIRGLFTSRECRFLAGVAAPAFAPSVVVDPTTGALVPNPVRTSDAAAFPLVAESPAIQALNRRLAKASGTDVRQGEPLQVLRYRAGQEYRPHFDTLPSADNQRIITVLVWLNETYEGGETRFEANGLEVRGEVGDALMFRNADESGVADPRSRHSGLPVTKGEKLIASRWIRQRPLVG